MARPLRDGMLYFNKDTDFYSDDKIRILRAEFGAKGMYLLDYLLCDLYGKNGYYIKWDKNKCFLVSDGAGCGCSPDFIGEFISGCLRCSFFSERVFNAFGVLTSAGIQRRYIRMFNSRDTIVMRKEYWLLDTSNRNDVPISVLNKLTFISDKSTGNPDKSTENPDKSTGNPQKESKRKEKESKGNNMHSAEESPPVPPVIEPPSIPPVIKLPLNDQTDHPVYQSDIDYYRELYPAVDVLAELRKMVGWCDANPKRRKTKAGIKRFINSWLSKAQDSAKAQESKEVVSDAERFKNSGW